MIYHDQYFAGFQPIGTRHSAGTDRKLIADAGGQVGRQSIQQTPPCSCSVFFITIAGLATIESNLIK